MDLNTLVAGGFGYWLAGFIDGEGCFLISQRKGRAEYGAFCRLVVELRRDEMATLEMMQKRLGIGALQHLPDRASPGANPLTRWIVSSKRDCGTLVRVLDRFPMRARKAADYAIWREAVFVWLAGGRGTTDWERMLELKAALIASRRYEARIAA